MSDTNEPRFGPANNAPMDRAKTIKITVPARWKASFTFSSESAYDNVIVIYDAHSLRALHTAGNHGRSLAPWTFEGGDKGATQLLVSGWHQEGTGNAGLPWIQNISQKSGQHGQSAEGGYEDWTDMDFNDIAFRVKVHK